MNRLRWTHFVSRAVRHWAAMAGGLLFLCPGAGTPAQDTGTAAGSAAQAPSPPQNPEATKTPDQSAKAQSENKAEISTQDTGTTFKLRVNLVQVHVVVRDGKGNPIPNLQREDFQIFDQGKLQPISVFAVNNAGDAEGKGAGHGKDAG